MPEREQAKTPASTDTREDAIMAKRHSENDLWAFINRADTHERIRIAFDFIAKQEYLSDGVMDDMCNALAFKSRELYRDATL